MRQMIYFHSGELVKLKQDLPNKPVMMVVRVVKSRLKAKEDEKKSNMFLGIKCCWFTEGGLYQEQIFNSKDLEHIED
jgi:hypothetical protein